MYLIENLQYNTKNYFILYKINLKFEKQIYNIVFFNKFW